MKNSRILWLIIAILIISFLVILGSSRIVNIARQTSKLDMGPQQFINKSVQTKHAVTFPVKSKDVNANAARTDTIQNQSETDDQASLTTSFENITHPKICVAQWREELITTEEALRCIDGYMQEWKSANCTSEYRGEDQCLMAE